jgi:AcrR family transcriptional regulator
MSARGETTRTQILDRASQLARREGLGGLTIGALATDLGLSKSGLFAHFGSKEALQVAILEYTAQRFVDGVVRPALREPRGLPRLRTAFTGWLDWGLGPAADGCLFVDATTEFDDRPGPVRDSLVAHERDWLGALAQIVRAGIEDGRFRADVDPEQVAFELYGILLTTHRAARLMGDPAALQRAHTAFTSLVRNLG